MLLPICKGDVLHDNAIALIVVTSLVSIILLLDCWVRTSISLHWENGSCWWTSRLSSDLGNWLRLYRVCIELVVILFKVHTVISVLAHLFVLICKLLSLRVNLLSEGVIIHVSW